MVIVPAERCAENTWKPATATSATANVIESMSFKVVSLLGSSSR
jgi:hypothetical protein